MLLAGTGPTERDTTRGEKEPAEILGLFRLDDSDRAELADIPGGDQIKLAWIGRRSGSSEATWVEPQLHRDRSPRNSVVYGIKGFLARFIPSDPALAEWLTRVVDQLGADVETFEPGVVSEWREVARATRHHPWSFTDRGDDTDDSAGSDAKATVAGFADRVASELEAVAELELRPSPARAVADTLAKRLPPAAVFRVADRELSSEYYLEEIAIDTPPVLANLCRIAGVDLRLLASIWQGDRAQAEGLIEGANDRLKEHFDGAWKQFPAAPRFGVPADGWLRIFVSSESAHEFTLVDERSDGLRWFVALDSFLAATQSSRPVLLVDEAETHLHYDAQADLVDELMRQGLTSKVVYSTHSVGCLPPDLGRGIRAVVPDRESGRSVIESNPWARPGPPKGSIGFGTLFASMGATLLPFTVPRHAVICEGLTEAILLPTLFREVTGLTSLPYRIIPGLAQVATSDLIGLDELAGRVVFLTDGDESGKVIGRRVQDGVPGASVRLFSLSDLAGGCTLEELLDPDVLAEAVNRTLEGWALTPARLTAKDLPSPRRSAKFKEWCKTNGLDYRRIDKRRIAQNVVNLRFEAGDGCELRPVVDTELAPGLRELHDRLLTSLGLDGVSDQTRFPDTART
jgi:hypothetical protein